MMMLIGTMLMGATLGYWPFWGGDVSHQALQLMKGGMEAEPALKWEFATNGTVAQFSAIADCDEDGATEVIFGSYAGSVYCVDGTTGATKWVFSTGDNKVTTSPGVVDLDGDGKKEVLIGTSYFYDSIYIYGKLYCLRGEDGSVKWSFQADNFIYSSPVAGNLLGDGTLEVVFGCNDGKVYCLDGKDGLALWTYATGSPVRSSPALGDMNNDGVLEVVVSSGNKVYCLNHNSIVLWVYANGHWDLTSPAVSDLDGDGYLDVVVGADGLYVLNGATGSLKWLSNFGGTYSVVTSTPAIADDIDRDGYSREIMVAAYTWVADTGDTDSLYINLSYYTYGIYCLDGATGLVEWVYETGVPVYGALSLLDVEKDDILEVLIPVFVSDTGGGGGDTDSVHVLYAIGSGLTCLNAENGSLLWSKPLASGAIYPFSGDIDGDSCSEIMVGAGNSMYALDDDSKGCTHCGVYVENTVSLKEGAGTINPFSLKALGGSVYLFMPTGAGVSLCLYDASGRLTQVLFNGVLGPGEHKFVPEHQPKGVYLVVLRYPGGTKSVKLVR
ncbi:MAG: PQQ-binding-like beta-propeller repeat protein [candidate division WOR-3 bacterium]